MNRIKINTGWQFKLEKDIDWNCGLGFNKYGEGTGGGARFLDYNNWENVTIPHDWAIYLPKNRLANTFGGGRAVNYYSRFYTEEHTNLDELYSVGWYRREIEYDKEWTGKRIYITFEGIFRDSVILVNGVYLDRHTSGYTGITLDITDHLFPDEKNTVAVRVDARCQEGWWYEGAGIYRDVYLDIAECVHILPDEIAVRADADGRVDVSMRLASFVDREVVENLRISVIDRTGKKVTGGIAVARLSAFGEADLHTSLTVDTPSLWSPEQPNLYTLEVEGTDTHRVVFGFCTFEFDADRGFTLNGQPYKIRGACVHQDFGGVGTALSDNLQYYKIRRLKEMGVNAYRCSHNAPSPALLRACDEVGMLVMDETRMFGTSPEAKRELTALVKRDRNHPSVFIWCVGNEEFAVENKEISRRLVEGMTRIIKSLDPTRRVVYAGENGPNFIGANRAAEVRGVNYIRNGEPGWLDKYHAEHPTQPIIGTEESSYVLSRTGSHTDTCRGLLDCFGDTTMMWGSTPKGWVKFYEERPWLAGGFMWTGFDYRGEPNPFHYINCSSSFGTIDLCGIEKPPFYYYKAWWTDEPVIKIAAPWKHTVGEEVTVTVFTNLPEVELLLNGRSVGRAAVEKFDVARFNVRYEDGQLMAVGVRDGIRYADVMKTWGDLAYLRVDTVLSPVGEFDTGIAEITALDENGNNVYDASERISLTVDGGKIIGVGNGDPADMEYEALCDVEEYTLLSAFDFDGGVYTPPEKTGNVLAGRRDFVYREEKVDGFEDDYRIVAAFNTSDLGKVDRTYTASFTDHVGYEYIEFERVDGDIEVYLNGEMVGDNRVDYKVKGNHVRPYRFPIRTVDGENQLVIKAALLGGSELPFSGTVKLGRRVAPKYEVSLHGGKARVFYRGKDAKIKASRK